MILNLRFAQLILLAVLSFSHYSSQTTNYLITVPVKVYADEIIKFQIVLMPEGLGRPNGTDNPSLINARIQGYPSTAFTFSIPDYKPQDFSISRSAAGLGIASSFKLEFEFRSNDLKSIPIFASNNVEVIQRDIFCFIQTDKPVYTNDETVGITIVGVNHLLKPLALADNTVIVVATKPDGSTVSPLAVVVEEGVAWRSDPTIELNENDLNTIGKWKLEVASSLDPSTVLASTYFWVKKLSQPNANLFFEFNPSYWLFKSSDESQYKGRVVAKNLNGAYIQGVAEVALLSTGGCNVHQYDFPITHGSTLPILHTDVDVEASAAGGQFQLAGLNNILTRNGTRRNLSQETCTLKFLVTFTEAGTGLITEQQAGVVLYRYSHIIDVDETSKNLKLYRGQHVDLRLKVTTPDGKAVGAGVGVKVTVNLWTPSNPAPRRPNCKKSYTKDADYHETLETDAQGKVVISIDVPLDLIKYRIRATLPDFDDHCLWYCDLSDAPLFTHTTNKTIWMTIDPVYRTTNPKAGDTLSFNIGSNSYTKRAYLLVSGLGGVYFYRKLYRSNYAAMFTADVVLTSVGAPHSSAIAWTVDEADNVIATAVTFRVDGLLRNEISSSLVTSMYYMDTLNKDMFLRALDRSNFVVQVTNREVYNLAVSSGLYITPGSVMQALALKKTAASAVSSNWNSGLWTYYHVENPSALASFLLVNFQVVSDAKLGSYTPPTPTATAVLTPPLINDAKGFTGIWFDGVEIAADLPATIANFESLSGPLGLVFHSFELSNAQATYDVSAIAVSRNFGLGFLLPVHEIAAVVDYSVKVELASDSVKLGEDIACNIILLSNRPTIQLINVTIQNSTFFQIGWENSTVFGFGPRSTLQALEFGQPKTLHFWIRPIAVGAAIEIKVDYKIVREGTEGLVTKLLEVQPPGEPVYLNDAHQIVSSFVNFEEFPAQIYIMDALDNYRNVVPGSVLAEASFTGDAFGPIFNSFIESVSLPNVVRLPVGCGEQNLLSLRIATLAKEAITTIDSSDMYKSYLKDQLNQLIIDGVKRQMLNYRRLDFGYSLFGNDDDASSTFLSAYTAHAFSEVHRVTTAPYVALLSNDVTNAWNYVLRMARDDGLFNEFGHPIHRQMITSTWKGRVNLAAYITLVYNHQVGASTLLTKWPKYDVTKQLLIDTAKNDSLTDNYQRALILAALTINNVDDISAADYTAILTKLLAAAKPLDGDRLWWQFYDGTANQDALSVETAANVMLAMVNGPTPALYSVQITKTYNYLTSMRNSLGGFQSTFDTQQALLAIYYMHFQQILIDFQQDQFDGYVQFYYTEDGTKGEWLLFPSSGIISGHIFKLYTLPPDEPQKVTTFAKFKFNGVVGDPYYQLSTSYSVFKRKSEYFPYFEVKEQTATSKSKSANSNIATLKTCVKPSCAFSTKVIIEMTMATGFEVDFSETNDANLVPQGDGTEDYQRPLRKIELGYRTVFFYLDELPHAKFCVITKVKQVIETASVHYIQKPQARIYSYYEPWTQRASIQYSFEAMQNRAFYPRLPKSSA